MYNLALNQPTWNGTHKPAFSMRSTVTTGTSAKLLRQYAAEFGIGASADLRRIADKTSLVNKLNQVWEAMEDQKTQAINNAGELAEAYEVKKEVIVPVTSEEPMTNDAKGSKGYAFGFNLGMVATMPRRVARRGKKFLAELARA